MREASGRTNGALPPTAPSDPIRLFVVEDNRLLREGIVALLSRRPDIRVLGSAACSDTALPAIQASAPGALVVLLDASLAEDDSAELVEAILRSTPDARVIVMDLLPEPAELTRFHRAGAAGFIVKEATTDEIVRVIRTVAGGESEALDLQGVSIISSIASQAAARRADGIHKSLAVTSRERRIIELISEGRSNRDIAQRLHITSTRVRAHIQYIVEKLALRDSIEREAAVAS